MAFLFTAVNKFLRDVGSRFFYRFGLHCAEYQIRVILISCVVITSLIYPALAIYFSSQPISHFSTPLRSTLFGTHNGPSSVLNRPDIRNIWDGYDSLHVRENAAAQARCGVERTIRLERLLLPGIERGTDGVLNHPTLLRLLHLQQNLESIFSSQHDSLRCVTDASGSCIVLGPVLHWRNHEEALLSDRHIVDTMNTDLNFTTANIPTGVDMLLYGYSPDLSFVTESEFLVLSYFFEETDCQGNGGHGQWLDSLMKAASPAEVTYSLAAHKLIALQYDPDQSRSRLSLISAFFYLVYAIVFVHVSGSLKRMDTVHSRFGLAFTGIIEILASTMTSASVCALWGFRVTMVPWSILPIVIVFVGAENMFSLMEAVTSTSITLSVKQRIAIGLAQAGTSNTLKVFVYNAVLGTIAFFATGAIQQFCIFAIVVLVAHWFLIHTFFVAVLSIDIQRLELSELLRQGIAAQPLGSPNTVQPVSSRSSSSAKWSDKVKAILRGRAARNGSLVLMLAITAILWWITYPTPPKSNDTYHHTSTSVYSEPNLSTPSPALRLWNLFNPSGDPLLHVRIESPSLVTYPSDADEPPSRQTAPPRITLRSFRPIIRLTNIVIAPIAITTGLLYLLLLYLLKNAELLEAQRHRDDADGPSTPRDRLKDVEPGIAFSTLFRAFASDVELVAASQDGEVVVCVSLNNEAVVWYGRSERHSILDCADVTGSDGMDQITCVAIDVDGRIAAIGTDSAAIGLFTLVSKSAKAEALLRPTSVSRRGMSPISSLLFSHFENSTNECWKSTLLVACEDGTAFDWDFHDSVATELRSYHARTASKPFLLSILSGRLFRVALPLDDGSIEVVGKSTSDAAWTSLFILPAGTYSDPVCSVNMNRLTIGDDITDVIVTGTYSGKVTFWDDRGDRIGFLDDVHDPIHRIRIALIPSRPCQSCSELSIDSFICACSTGDLVHIYRGSIPFQADRCSCFSNQLLATHSQGHFRSRSGSLASSETSSPIRTRVKLPPLEQSSYPIAPHSRRSSAVDRNDREPNGRIRHGNGNGNGAVHVDVDTTLLEPGTSSAESVSRSPWQSARLKRIASVNSERGEWDLHDHVVVGIRRRPRTSQKPGSKTSSQKPGLGSKGSLSASVLERWELWTFDPSQMDSIRASSLASLVAEDELSYDPGGQDRVNTRARDKNTGRQVRTVENPRLPFTRVSPFIIVSPTCCVAGLGNTVGLLDIPSSATRTIESTKSVSLSVPVFRKRL